MTGISEPRHKELATTLRERLGEDLRSVRVVASTDEGATHEHVHLRDDLRDEYTEEENRRITEEIVYHTIDKEHRDRLFRSGEANYTVYGFDEALVFLFYDDPYGTAVSVESEFDGTVRELAGDCLSALESKI